MDMKSQLPVIIRYILVSVCVALATRGWLTQEQSAILTQNADIIIGAVGALATVAYALMKRPSAKALDAARQIDRNIPPEKPVVIKTPAGERDIVIPPK